MTGPLSPALQAGKRAVADLIGAAGGGERAAAFCRVGQQKLSDYGSINKPDVFMPVDVIADLEGVTCGLPGAPHVTRYLARRAGFELFALPEAAAAACWHGLLAQFAKEGADVMAKIATHAPEGISAAEVKSSGLIGEIDEAIAILVNMRAAACAIIEGR